MAKSQLSAADLPSSTHQTTSDTIKTYYKAAILIGLGVPDVIVSQEIGIDLNNLRIYQQIWRALGWDITERNRKRSDFVAYIVEQQYKNPMENVAHVAKLLLEWDAKAVDALLDDLQSGELIKQYRNGGAQQAPAPHEGAIEPPKGQHYAERSDRKETAPAFIERVYGEAGWLTGSFTRADLRKLDPAAMMGLSNWERGNGRAKLNLPTLKERTDQELSDPDHRQRARHGGRLNAALRRREPQ